MGVFYTAIGQGTQGLVWSLVLFVITLLIAIGIVGLKKLCTKNRLKWFVVHTIIILVLGFLLNLIAQNSYIETIIFVVLFTLLVKLYRQVTIKEKWILKDLLKWFVIYLLSFFFITMTFDMTGAADSIIRIVYAGLIITLLGAIFSIKK